MKENENRTCEQKFDCYTYLTNKDLHTKVTSDFSIPIETKIICSPLPDEFTEESLDMLLILRDQSSQEILATQVV